MARTTINLDNSILQQLKLRGRRDGKNQSDLVNQLLAWALSSNDQGSRPLRWTSQPMGARIDLEDKEAVRRILDGGGA